MKKTILLMWLISLFSLARSQFLFIDSLHINVSKVVAADTIIPFETEQLMSTVSIDIGYTTLNQDDGTVEIMVANRRGDWKPVPLTGWPYTLDVTTNTDTLTTKASVSAHWDNLPYPFMAIRYKKGTTSSGYLDAKRIFIAPVKRNASFP